MLTGISKRKTSENPTAAAGRDKRKYLIFLAVDLWRNQKHNGVLSGLLRFEPVGPALSFDARNVIESQE